MIKRTFKTIVLLLLCGLTATAAAQTAVVSGGGTASGSTYSVSYSVGQLAVGSASSSNHSVREGVLQPITVQEVSIGTTAAETGIRVFPNPTTDGVTLQRPSVQSTTVQLYSLEGRLLREERWEGSEMQLNLASLPSGTYLLKTDKQTFKITKQ